MKQKQLAEYAKKELQKCQENGDAEGAHSIADDILCEVLVQLGYQEVVDEWNKVDKWYA